ncbi:hypothetical protein [Nonomuraea insulae]|uniref:MmyB-like transcription regulator ligand binding domain-containing protein n=1 Tax=Nonomuraea insulae TaxID=1616787 RepID=A0ABW1CI46_9ACTN
MSSAGTRCGRCCFLMWLPCRAGERSMMRWTLLDPRARLVWCDWERVARDYVHGLRMAAAAQTSRLPLEKKRTSCCAPLLGAAR